MDLELSLWYTEDSLSDCPFPTIFVRTTTDTIAQGSRFIDCVGPHEKRPYTKLTHKETYRHHSIASQIIDYIFIIYGLTNTTDTFL